MTDGTRQDTAQHDDAVVRIVSGSPTDEEIAALTAVLAAIPTAEEATSPIRTSRWADRRALMRKPHDHRRGAWHHWER